MNAKDEGRQWAVAPVFGGWQAWIRGKAFVFKTEVQAEECRDYLNALQQQVTELEGKAARYERALTMAADREAMHREEFTAKYNVDNRTYDWMTSASVAEETLGYDAYDSDSPALTSPSTIAQEEQR